VFLGDAEAPETIEPMGMEKKNHTSYIQIIERIKAKRCLRKQQQ